MIPAQASEQHLYQTVADSIVGMIEGGTLRVGDRVPSVRYLSAQRKVSVSTVLQAYRDLENKGWLEARPQSGYYVRRTTPHLLPEPEISQPSLVSTTVDLGEVVAQFFRATNQPNIIQMGAAIGDPASFPTRALTRALAATVRQYSDALNRYDLPPGNQALRVQIAQRAIEGGCALTPDEIVITTGCTEALNLALRAVASPGDTILLESPTYYSALQIIEALGMRALELPTHPRTGLSLEALEYALDQEKIAACLLMPCLHNPLGSCMPEEDKKRLINLLNERNIPLIEDDVWGDTSFDSPRPRAVKSYDTQGNVLLCSSFSKTIAPGYRIGWVAAGRFHKKVEYLKLVGTLGNPSLTSLALAHFLDKGGYDHHLRSLRRLHAQQVQSTIDLLEKHFSRCIKVTRPCGGQFVWVELPESVDTVSLFHRALAKGICIAPGALFSAKGKYHNFMRLYCGYHDHVTTDRAIEQLARLALQ